MKTFISPIYGKGQQVRSYSTEWTTPKRDIQCSISEEMRYEQIMDGLYIVAQNKKCNRLFKRVLRFLIRQMCEMLVSSYKKVIYDEFNIT